MEENIKYNHEDLGPKIGGARKDLYINGSLNVSSYSLLNEKEKSEKINKNEIWKKVDYQFFYDNNYNADYPLFVNNIKKYISTSPIKISLSVFLYKLKVIHKEITKNNLQSVFNGTDIITILEKVSSNRQDVLTIDEKKYLNNLYNFFNKSSDFIYLYSVNKIKNNFYQIDSDLMKNRHDTSVMSSSKLYSLILDGILNYNSNSDNLLNSLKSEFEEEYSLINKSNSHLYFNSIILNDMAIYQLNGDKKMSSAFHNKMQHDIRTFLENTDNYYNRRNLYKLIMEDGNELGFLSLDKKIKIKKENILNSENKVIPFELFLKTKKERVKSLTQNNIEEQIKQYHLQDFTRTGFDWRNGEDISTEKFRDTFKFKSIEYGNWVDNDERQTLINFLYESLMDLALYLDVSPETLTFDGNLSITLGSRGVAGARAFFEPSRFLFHYNKMSGSGALAHEWFHALDYYSNGLDKTSFLTNDILTILRKNKNADINDISDGYKLNDVEKSMYNVVKNMSVKKNFYEKEFEDAVKKFKDIDNVKNKLFNSYKNQFQMAFNNYLKQFKNANENLSDLINYLKENEFTKEDIIKNIEKKDLNVNSFFSNVQSLFSEVPNSSDDSLKNENGENVSLRNYFLYSLNKNNLNEFYIDIENKINLCNKHINNRYNPENINLHIDGLFNIFKNKLDVSYNNLSIKLEELRNNYLYNNSLDKENYLNKVNETIKTNGILEKLHRATNIDMFLITTFYNQLYHFMGDENLPSNFGHIYNYIMDNVSDETFSIGVDRYDRKIISMFQGDNYSEIIKEMPDYLIDIFKSFERKTCIEMYNNIKENMFDCFANNFKIGIFQEYKMKFLEDFVNSSYTKTSFHNHSSAVDGYLAKSYYSEIVEMFARSGATTIYNNISTNSQYSNMDNLKFSNNFLDNTGNQNLFIRTNLNNEEKYYINPRNEERETITNSILEFTKVYFKDKPKFDKSILNGLNIIENQYHDSKKTKNKKEKPKDVNKKDDIKLIDKVSSDNKPITTEVVTNEFLDKKPLKKEQQLTLFK